MGAKFGDQLRWNVSINGYWRYHAEHSEEEREGKSAKRNTYAFVQHRHFIGSSSSRETMRDINDSFAPFSVGCLRYLSNSLKYLVLSMSVERTRLDRRASVFYDGE